MIIGRKEEIKLLKYIRKRINDLTKLTKTKHAIYPTLITSYGLIQNGYASNIQSVITSDDLFLC